MSKLNSNLGLGLAANNVASEAKPAQTGAERNGSYRLGCDLAAGSAHSMWSPLEAPPAGGSFADLNNRMFYRQQMVAASPRA